MAAQTHIAFLRAVNVGGTGKLPMAELKNMCAKAGFTDIRTYIASGNLVFRSELDEIAVRSELESRLEAYVGKPVGVIMRTPEELSNILASSPFPDAPGNKVNVLLLDRNVTDDDIASVSNLTSEVIRPGIRELYIHYPDGQGRSKLKIPAGNAGTARNMNTISKMNELSQMP